MEDRDRQHSEALRFVAAYAPPDEEIAAGLLSSSRLSDAERVCVDALAGDLIGAVRNATGVIGGVEDLLHEYSLSTREGVAMMMLAEALVFGPYIMKKFGQPFTVMPR